MPKKVNLRILSLFVLVVLSFIITGCPPPIPPVSPTVTTTQASSVTAISVTTGGDIAEDGGAAVTEKGICWNTISGPTIANNPIKAGNGLGNYTVTISGLNPGVTYYVRAYATNSAGTAYGNEVTFTTPVIPSTITTTAATAITGSSATSGGNITIDGGGAVTARGVCWGTTTNPTIALPTKTSDGTGIGSFVSAITALAPATKYYVRAYATNSAGTAYGNELTFNTPVIPSTVTTTVVTAITGSSATSGGNITIDGGGAVTARGVCWSKTTNPTIDLPTKTSDGTGVGSFGSLLTALTPGTKYYVRAYATNSAGTAYGNEVTFTALIITPIITAASITMITATTASSGGNITFDGGAPVSARGVCWSTTTGPTIANSKTSDGNGIGLFTSLMTNLSPNTTYFLRGYATNSAGTAYTDNVTFKTLPAPPIDADGNTYKTVTIGTQTWFAENLKTTRYSDGSIIPLVTNIYSWFSLYTPGYCWYNNNAANYKSTYGALYNWYTVNTKKLCPSGWHLPSDAELMDLINFLGGESVAGGKLKETGTSHWSSPNEGATNTTGFTALPGGVYTSNGFWHAIGSDQHGVLGGFGGIGSNGCWWSSTEKVESNSGWSWYMDFSSSNVSRNNGSKQSGFSVRCLRD